MHVTGKILAPIFLPTPDNPQFCDHAGKRFGRLLVLGYGGRSSSGSHTHWWCRCDCGAISRPTANKLTRGAAQSCGCLRRDRLSAAATVHGFGSRGEYAEYSSFIHMKGRCLNPRDAAFKDYGGRGIQICDRWRFGEGGRSGFECFLADLGFKPSPLHTLDRIKSEGNYEPSNCRWGTKKQQARNRRSNHYVTLNGERISLVDACERLHLGYSSVNSRIRRGWTFERAISDPPRASRPRLRKRVGMREWQRIRKRIFQRDGYACVYCNGPSQNLECDHVLAVSRGGTDEDSNLRTSCQHCNRTKNDQLLGDWQKPNVARPR